MDRGEWVRSLGYIRYWQTTNYGFSENRNKACWFDCKRQFKARDGICSYGEDIDETITPVEARYWGFLAGKRIFIGKR